MSRSTKCAADSSSLFFEIECFTRLRSVTIDSAHQLLDYMSIYNLLVMPLYGIDRKVREYAVYSRLCRLFPTLYQFDYPSHWSGIFEFYLRVHIELVISKLTAARPPYDVIFKVEKEEPEEDSSDDEVDVGF